MDKNDICLLFVAVCSAVLLRMVTFFSIMRGDGVNIIGNDSWYILRQVDVIRAFGEYGWFDMWTNYPMGSEVFWGPLTAKSVALLAHFAQDRAGIVFYGSFFPVICGVLCVLLCYLLVSQYYGSKSGIYSAFCMALIGGGYLYRSVYGNVDHHSFETLASIMFILAYAWILSRSKNAKTKKSEIILGGYFLSLVYLVGWLNMPTMAYLGLIIIISYTLSICLIKDVELLNKFVALHSVMWYSIFVMTSLLVFSWGGNVDAVSFTRYTSTHCLLYALAGVWTAVSYLLIRTIRVRKELIKTVESLYESKRPKFIKAAIILGIGCFIIVFFGTGYYLKSGGNTGIHHLIALLSYIFGGSAITGTITEAQSIFANVSMSFIVILPIVVVGGIRFVKERIIGENVKDGLLDSSMIFWWSAITCLMVITHVRYEYLFAPIMAFYFGVGADYLVKSLEVKVKGKRSKAKINKGVLIVAGSLVILGAFSVMGVYGASNDETYGYKDDWKEALYWMNENTPQINMSYTDPVYQTPDGYSVGAWWDFGHMITYFGQRPAIANPFQQGATTMADFFMTSDESHAVEIANETGMKYVMIDSTTAYGYIPAILTWADKDMNDYLQMNDGKLEFYLPLYDTMLVRLYYYNGYGANGRSGLIRSTSLSVPPCDITPLEHFSLVYATENGNVEIFEYIP